MDVAGVVDDGDTETNEVDMGFNEMVALESGTRLIDVMMLSSDMLMPSVKTELVVDAAVVAMPLVFDALMAQVVAIGVVIVVVIVTVTTAASVLVLLSHGLGSIHVVDSYDG